MKLFDDPYDSSYNLLPRDGTVYYYGKLLSPDMAEFYFEKLLHHIDWQYDQAQLFGKVITTKRKVAWYGEKPFEYTYSKVTKRALPWTSELIELKNKVELETGKRFNSCLLNLYHSGEEGMGWHSDGEKDLKKNGAIGSLSLGAERKFAFKHKDNGQKVEIRLEQGSLLVMKDETQKFWLHRLPPTKRIPGPRINLTFRTIVK
jgi:alkylated DNA repair dioxygenase AlkB